MCCNDGGLNVGYLQLAGVLGTLAAIVSASDTNSGASIQSDVHVCIGWAAMKYLHGVAYR